MTSVGTSTNAKADLRAHGCDKEPMTGAVAY
jgi:hypothetical protein